jgi:hypothetical protein
MSPVESLDQRHVRLAGDWLLTLIWWLVSSKREVLLTGG